MLHTQVVWTANDVDDLFYGAGAGPSLGAHLDRLQASGTRAFGRESLLELVRAQHLATAKHKKEWLSYLRSDVCQMFSSPDGQTKLVWPSAADMERLYAEGNAGEETLKDLRDFDACQVRFQTMEELLEAVHAAHVLIDSTQAAEVGVVRAYLSSSKCDLFLDQSAVGLTAASVKVGLFFFFCERISSPSQV